MTIPWYAIQELRPGQVLSSTKGKFKSPSFHISSRAQIATDMWMFTFFVPRHKDSWLSVISATDGRWFIFIHLSSNQRHGGSTGVSASSIGNPEALKYSFCSMIRSWRFSKIYIDQSWQDRSKSLSSWQTNHLWSSLCSPCVLQCFPWPQQLWWSSGMDPERSPRGKTKSMEVVKWSCPAFFSPIDSFDGCPKITKITCSSCLDPDFQRHEIGLASRHSVINFDQWTSEIRTGNSGHWLTWPFPFYWSSRDNWLLPGRKGLARNWSSCLNLC